MHCKTLAALVAVAALAVAGCGSDDGSGSAGSPTSTTSPGASAGNGVDRAFVAAMIPHHESAVEMAEIAQGKAESEFVKQLAEGIVRTQNAEIATMRSEDTSLEQAGVKGTSLGVAEHMMGMDADMSMLETAKPFDAAFLNMMIPHHEGAVTMAKAELAKGGDPELKKLAQAIVDAQQREITEMTTHLGDGSSGSTGHPMTTEHSGS